jgi:hypothetical protein
MSDFLHNQHAGKVIGNSHWYEDRFDQYNEVIKLLNLYMNIVQQN